MSVSKPQNNPLIQFISSYQDAPYDPSEEAEFSLSEQIERENRPQPEPNEYNYLKTSDNKLFLSYDTQIVDTTKPGIYDLLYDGERRSFYITPKKIDLDELFDLKSKEFDLITEDIHSFMGIKEHFVKYNFVYKRGYLLYGKQGIGKTSIINRLALKFIADGHDIIVFQITSAESLNEHIGIMKGIKKREPNKIFFIIVEDIDNFLKHYEVESSLINFLDGSSQLSGVITFATTNYPEELKERITNRPNRFDRIVEVQLPTENVRRQYFENKFSILTEDDRAKYNINKIIEDTEGWTLAHCQELFKSIVIFQHNYEDTLGILNDMNTDKKLKNTTQNPKIGFGKWKLK